jgi:hypothetical protein
VQAFMTSPILRSYCARAGGGADTLTAIGISCDSPGLLAAASTLRKILPGAS